MKLAMISKMSLILAVASIAFVSCKKDKGSGPNPAPVTKKVSRIEENGQTTATFQYNTDGALKTIMMDLGLFGATTFNISYTAQKKISEIVTSEGDKAKFIYESGNLQWVEHYEDNQKVSESHFTYLNGKMTSNTLFTGFPDGNGNITYRPTFKTEYHYATTGGLQRVSTYQLNDNNQLALEYEYVYPQYDNKTNPLTVINEFSQVMLYQPIPVNNPIVEKLLAPNGSVSETTENAYTYDAAGYPSTLTSTVTAPGQTPTVRTVKFFY
jgi:hypothetical protein